MQPASEVKKQLRRELGFWDVLLFQIAAVLGPRWIAAAAHNGTSSMSLWVLAAVFFFVPTALVISELSSRFPHEGGLYVWTKEAFGEFHGFVAGWTYWVYTFFYFPALLTASVAMSAYVGGSGAGHLAQDRAFLLVGAMLLFAVAVWLNLIGLNIGKWLQNAGGVGTYLPLILLAGVAAAVWHKFGSQTHFTWQNMQVHWNWDTVNFWSNIAFAFTGMELVATMSEEMKDPRKTIPRAIFGSGAMIAVIYMIGTVCVLVLQSAVQTDPKSGVFQALSAGSSMLGLGFIGVIAALLVTVGNAGGVGTTVAGIARVPFVVGIDRYMPRAFGRIHPRWHTPYVSIIVQAVISAAILLVTQISETVNGAYQILVDATIVLNFIPFLYMYAAAIKLSGRKDRAENPHAVLIPGGKLGVWVAGALGFAVVGGSMLLALIPPGESQSKVLFEVKVIGGTLAAILFGLVLYWRGSREKRMERTQ